MLRLQGLLEPETQILCPQRRGEAKWRSYGNTVSNALDMRGGREEEEIGLEKKERGRERECDGEN